MPSDSVIPPASRDDSASVITPQQSPENDENLEYIAGKVARNQCILFLGSAIHVPPSPDSRYQYSKEKSPPIGGELSAQLAKKSGFQGKDTWNLQRVTQHYESKKSRFRLVEEIAAAVRDDREPSPVLYALTRLNFPIVVTTNYDQLYEKALGKPRDQIDVCIYNPDNSVPTTDCSATPSPARPYILKIHGDIDEPESIVITEEDYIHFMLRMGDKQPFHPVGKNVLTYLAKWPTLFIGYSLMDYNFRVLFKTIRWQLDAARIPPNYSVDIKPDDLIRDIYENQRRQVTFIVENLWDYVPKLYRAVKKEEMPSSVPPEQQP